MKVFRYVLAVAVVGVIAWAAMQGAKTQSGEIVIGAKNFTEQTIIGEMAAQLIEAKTDLTVARKFNLGSNLPMKMLKNGELDLYLDYTGTGYADILGQTYKQQPPEEIYNYVAGKYPEQFNIEWLSPLGFNNTYTLTMRNEQAQKLGIEKISDLKDHTGLTAGFDSAFLDRQDGYPGLQKWYGFEFDQQPSQLASGLMYSACEAGKVDVIDAFATDGRIPKFDLRVLKDDKQFFPPYDAAFVVRQDTLKKHPAIKDALELLAGKFDNETMRNLNYQVDEGGKRASEVARDFLVENDLIKATPEETNIPAAE